MRSPSTQSFGGQKREFFIDNLLVRIHSTIVMIGWTGLAPWEFEFPFPRQWCAWALFRSRIDGMALVSLGGAAGHVLLCKVSDALHC